MKNLAASHATSRASWSRALHIELSNVSVYFEHHILLWKDPAVQVGLRPMKGAIRRMLAGMPFLLTGASGWGRIAFSRDGAGHVLALHLKPGMAIDVREHQWLAATDAVEYSSPACAAWPISCLAARDFSSIPFQPPRREGILWIHGFGNVFEVTLARANPSTSNRAAGFTRTRRCRCRRCSKSFPRDYSPAADESAGIVSPVREKDRFAIHVFPHGKAGSEGGAAIFPVKPI